MRDELDVHLGGTVSMLARGGRRVIEVYIQGNVTLPFVPQKGQLLCVMTKREGLSGGGTNIVWSPNQPKDYPTWKKSGPKSIGFHVQITKVMWNITHRFFDVDIKGEAKDEEIIKEILARLPE